MGFAVAGGVFVGSEALLHALPSGFHVLFLQLGSVVARSGWVLRFDGIVQAVFYIFQLHGLVDLCSLRLSVAESATEP